MSKHIHADLMAQYAQDALTTDKPWELWECRYPPSTSPWHGFSGYHPAWLPDYEYRRKPDPIKTRVVNGFTVPAPMTEAPKVDTPYFCVTPSAEDWYIENAWDECCTELMWLKRGLLFATEEAAVATAKAMCGVDPEWRQS